MLEVSNLRRSYGDVIAVDDVSFQIKTGEIVGLLGHNGAGKTTIMKMLCGYLEPNHGEIMINQQDIQVHPKTVQRALGYLPENLPVYQEMTVADYLDYAADLKGLCGDTKRNEIRRALTATDISDKLLSPIATLSRGYKQRVGVAQAILGNPSFLILDEPTNGLDPTQTDHMRELIRQLAENATVILSTHIMQEVDAVCDRVLILNRGRLALDARLDELRRSNRLLLSTSIPPAQKALLLEIDGIESLESTASGKTSPFEYHLTLTDSDRLEPISAAVAKAIATGGYDLYQLRSEHRNLETVFREVSSSAINTSGEDISNAA